jgi:FHS family L-fucose permease-like MFS transporter
LDLKRWQAGIVDSAFYAGYFVMAIPAGIFMRKWGYKKGILAGLLLYAVGALLFYPAANIRVYSFFLFALFTIASGLAFLETAANLYVTVLGDKKDAAWRINFAQSFNGISIILGPVIGSLFIFSKKDYTPQVLSGMTAEEIQSARIEEAMSVQGPYLAVAALVLAVAILFALTKMPEVGREEEKETGNIGIFGLLGKYRHLSLGVLAQFANVGAQATLWGYFVDFKIDFAKDEHLAIVHSHLRANHLGDDRGSTRPSLNDGLETLLVENIHLFQEMVIYEWTFFEATRHQFLRSSSSRAACTAATDDQLLRRLIAVTSTTLGLAPWRHRMATT